MILLIVNIPTFVIFKRNQDEQSLENIFILILDVHATLFSDLAVVLFIVELICKHIVI